MWDYQTIRRDPVALSNHRKNLKTICRMMNNLRGKRRKVLFQKQWWARPGGSIPDHYDDDYL